MTTRLILCVGLALATANAYAAGDIKAGEKIATTVCQQCHGEGGNSTNAAYPRLAGQYPDYLVQALADYQNGNRKNPIMAPFVQNLSRADMENLAAYFASQKGLYVKP